MKSIPYAVWIIPAVLLVIAVSRLPYWILHVSPHSHVRRCRFYRRSRLPRAPRDSSVVCGTYSVSGVVSFRLPTNLANFGEEAFGEKLNRKSPL
jgi:hypothetical protein